MTDFPTRVAVVYAAVAAVWIIVSDLTVAAVFAHLFVEAQILTAGLFILVTTGLIYGLLRRESDRRADAEAALRASEADLRRTIETLPDVYFRTDAAGRIERVSPAAEAITGYSVDELLRMRSTDLYVDPTQRVRLVDALRADVTGPAVVELAMRRKDGLVFWAEANAFLRRGDDGTVIGVEGIIRDITGRRDMEEQLRHLTCHDMLTGLPNRGEAASVLQKSIARAKRAGTRVAVLCVDLDGFKDINEAHGHAQGDALLRKLAERLADLLRETDTAARMGGDEFLVVLEGNIDAGSSTMVAEKIIDSLSRPLRLSFGADVSVTASVGLALFPRDGVDPDTLLRNADRALYRAKAAGRNTYRIAGS